MSEVEKIMGLAVQLRDAAIDFGKTDDDVYERRSSIQVQNTQQALELALTQLVQDRDAWKRNHAELVHDFLPDFLGCLPACDSFGHSSDCPAVEPMAAQKALLKDRDRLEKERDEAVAQFEAKSTLCSKFHAPVYEENDRLEAANVKLQAEVLRLRELIRTVPLSCTPHPGDAYVKPMYRWCHFCKADGQVWPDTPLVHKESCIVRSV